MKFTQLLAESAGAMLANPLRTLLTMLGIIIGIASVVLMLAVGDGIKAFIDKQLAVLGSNLVLVQADMRKSAGARLRTGTVQTLTLDDAEAVNRLPSVVGAAPMLTTFSQISVGNDNSNTHGCRAPRRPRSASAICAWRRAARSPRLMWPALRALPCWAKDRRAAVLQSRSHWPNHSH